jgi:hypothetical protein
MSDAMQGCGPDCRAEEQGYPAPCEMYSDMHIAGCPRQSKAECCDALTLHAYDCERPSVPNTGTALSEEPDEDELTVERIRGMDGENVLDLFCNAFGWPDAVIGRWSAPSRSSTRAFP